MSSVKCGSCDRPSRLDVKKGLILNLTLKYIICQPISPSDFDCPYKGVMQGDTLLCSIIPPEACRLYTMLAEQAERAQRRNSGQQSFPFS